LFPSPQAKIGHFKNNSNVNEDKKDHDDNNDSNNNIFTNKINILKEFINEQIYPIVLNFKNINPIKIEIKEIIGEGFCLFRAISYFIKGNEYMYNVIRTQI
jgi:hypothetical protein